MPTVYECALDFKRNDPSRAGARESAMQNLREILDNTNLSSELRGKILKARWSYFQQGRRSIICKLPDDTFGVSITYSFGNGGTLDFRIDSQLR